MMAINETSRVTLHFSLSLIGGEVIDSNFDSAPATFTMGDGSLLPAFEAELIGMKEGEEKETSIQAEFAFGLSDSRNIQSFSRKQFEGVGKELDEDGQPLSIEPGLVLSFSSPSEGEVPGVIDRVEGQKVIVDFNHPLAGKDILYAVKITGVESSVTEPLV